MQMGCVHLTCKGKFVSHVIANMMVMSLAGVVSAGFVSPTTWTRGDLHTTYQEWDIFSSPSGPNAPDVGVYNPNGTPNLVDTSGGSFVTGGGNIYSPSAVLNIEVTIPDETAVNNLTTVILQTRTNGTEIDYNALNIGGISFVDQAELLRQPLGGFGGFAVERWFKFNLPYSAASFIIEFMASGTSMSLDRVAVDTFTGLDYAPEPNPVPEPATAGLLILGMSIIGYRRCMMKESQ